MKAFTTSLVALTCVISAAAKPVGTAYAADRLSRLSARQTTATDYLFNEFSDRAGNCSDVVLIHARGTMQATNMGQMPGPSLADALISSLSTKSVAIQGVNYDAGLLGNFEPGGCDAADAANMTALITQVATDCPTTKIAVSGYSQGAALVHASIKGASQAVQNNIVAAVTFGDTQNLQDGGQIRGFPTNRTKIFCNFGDMVCDGTLIIGLAHLDYSSSVAPAAAFIVSQVNEIDVL